MCAQQTTNKTKTKKAVRVCRTMIKHTTHKTTRVWFRFPKSTCVCVSFVIQKSGTTQKINFDSCVFQKSNPEILCVSARVRLCKQKLRVKPIFSLGILYSNHSFRSSSQPRAFNESPVHTSQLLRCKNDSVACLIAVSI